MNERLARVAHGGLTLLVVHQSVSLLLPVRPVTPAVQSPVAEPPSPGRRRSRSRSSAADGVRASIAGGVIALAAVAALAALGAPQLVRAILVFAAMAIVPGAAVTLRIRGTDAPTAVGLTVALSIAIGMFVALPMVWTGYWHPVPAGAIVGALSVLSILPLCRGRLRKPWAGWRPGATLAILPAALALVLWAMSLKVGADMVHLHGLGLPVGLKPAWYGALAIALTGAVLAISRREPNGWLIAAFIVAAGVIMYATLPAIDRVPQNPWVYKHIGVTNLIVQTGRVHPSVDIYNRWPGFFSLAAVYARLSGQPDAISFAAWSDPVFALLDAMLVAALARTLGSSKQVAGWAALLYIVSNFVVQDYFSPQAVAFVLSLAIFLLVLRQVAVLSRIRGWIDRLPQVGKREQGRMIQRLRIGPTKSLALILVLEVALVVTHELTPYIALLQVAGLAIVGVVRPPWRLLAVLAAVALAFLLTNINYVLAHYQLISGLDPVTNAAVHLQAIGVPWGVTHAGGVISILTTALALLAAVRLIRVGHGRAAIVLLALVAMPYALLFGQSYYGETSLRIFLFSAPWRVALIAWGLTTIPSGARQALAGFAVVASLTLLWLLATMGNAPIQVVPPGEVTASRAFYDLAPAGSMLMLAAPGFPSRSDARYAQMANSSYDANLTMYPFFKGRMLGSHEIPKLISVMHWYSRSDFLVFFSTADRYATTSGLLPPGSLSSLQNAVRKSPRFRLWFSDSAAQIYQVVK